MGVLESMRSSSDSTFMQIVLFAVAVSFVFMLARPDTGTTSAVATVNGEQILGTQLAREYRQQLRSAERNAGRTLSDPEQKQLQEKVKQQMIEDEVIQQEAERLGLKVSGTEVAMELRKFGGLVNDEGKFDREAYEIFLKQQGMSEDAFEAYLRNILLRQKLRFLAFMGATISEPSMRETWEELETRVDVEYVAIRPQSFADEVTITQEERDAYLAENADEIRSIYDRDFDRLYNHPEMVELSLIRLALTADGPGVTDVLPIANKLRTELEAGADFAELAKKWSEDPSALSGGKLGARNVNQLGEEEAKALAQMQPGEVSKAIVTDSDVRILFLHDRTPPTVDAFEDVQGAIVDKQIAAERTPALAATFAEETVAGPWAETGEVPRDALTEKGFAVTSTGPVPPVNMGNPFAPPQEMFDAARKAEPGTVLPGPFAGPSGILFVGKLVDRTEPSDEDFEAAKGELAEPMLERRRVDFYTNWVTDLKAQATIE